MKTLPQIKVQEQISTHQSWRSEQIREVLPRIAIAVWFSYVFHQHVLLILPEIHLPSDYTRAYPTDEQNSVQL
jgi:hypothetical protein